MSSLQRERSHGKPFLPLHRGPAGAPKRTSPKATATLTRGQDEKEEPAETVGMGNHQGLTKVKHHLGSAEMPEEVSGPRLQPSRKRGRSVEEGSCPDTLQHTLIQSSGTQWPVSQSRRLKRLWMMTTSPGGENQERGKAGLRTAASAGGAALRAVQEDLVEFDSDAELSEYDNELYLSYSSPSRPQEGMEPQASTRLSPDEGTSQTLSPAQESSSSEEWRPEGVEERARKRIREEKERRDAAWRVMGKIEEVEGIIRRVSLTSVDWIRQGREEHRFPSVPDGCEWEEEVLVKSQSQPEAQPQLQPRFQPRLQTQMPDQTKYQPQPQLQPQTQPQPQPQQQNQLQPGFQSPSQPMLSLQPQVELLEEDPAQEEERALPADKLRPVGEALSQSLSEKEATGPGERTFNSTESPWIPRVQSSSGQAMTLDPSTDQGNSPPTSLSAVQDGPSPSLSAILDVSLLLSCGVSPSVSHIQSPPPSPMPLPLTQPADGTPTTAQRERKSLAMGCSAPQSGGDCDSETTVLTSGAGSDKKNSSRKKVAWLDLSKPIDNLVQTDEALQKQEEIWKRKVEESLSCSTSMSHPPRPKHLDCLRITHLNNDVTSGPPVSPERNVREDASLWDLGNSQGETEFPKALRMNDDIQSEGVVELIEDSSAKLILPEEHVKLNKNKVQVQNFGDTPKPGSSCVREAEPAHQACQPTVPQKEAASPTDRAIQLPALFSGLRVLRKGVTGPEHDTVAQFKPMGKGVTTGKSHRLSRNQAEPTGSLLDQISQFLSLDRNAEEEDESRESPEAPTKPSSSSAESAFEAFKAFFTPKPLKKDASERLDLDAVRKRIRNDKDVLRAIFERTSNKTPEKTNPADGKSEVSTPGEGEDRTPGRLQAVWPPPKDEKLGLKYTEAEHQAALLHLKRECKEEVEKLQEDYGRQLSRLRVDSEETVYQLERTLAQLRAEMSLESYHRRYRSNLRDVAVSTADELSTRSIRNVCIQTERETFIRALEEEEGPGRAYPSPQSHTMPKRLDLASISLSLAGDSGGSGGPPPPPPPPPMPGCGLPPPPPLPGGGFLMDQAPRKPSVKPACPMKPLYWTRIQVQDANIINTGEFEDLFSKTTAQTKKKPLAEAFEKKTKAKKIVKLLDGKRSQAVGILISSLHLEMRDIQHAVLTVDNSVVDLETIEALYDNRAQPDELERIKKHFETSDEDQMKLLDKPEQFLYELSQIPDFPGRAHCIIFQSVFIDSILSLQRKVDIISKVCKVLLEHRGVRQVVALILALGNYMNGGNRTRGQADGFGLEILPKLKDVKSKDNRISLVDYVVSCYLRNLDESAGTDASEFPLPEPEDVFLAAQVKFEDLAKDLRMLRRDLTVCEKGMQTVCYKCPEQHLQPFKDKMDAFVLSAQKEHDETEYSVTSAQKSFQELVQFYGLKPKTGEKEVGTSNFFMLWFEFCTDFKTRWKRESKNISKERLKEAQLSVKRITSEKKVETRKINPNSLKERLRQKEASFSAT
ncbi:formin [Aplochiton taeniatus]